MLLVKLSEQNVWLFPDKAFIDIFDFTVQADKYFVISNEQ